VPDTSSSEGQDRLGPNAGAFGLTIGGRYQWASYSEDVGGRRLYRGPGVSLGLAYLFRYE